MKAKEKSFFIFSFFLLKVAAITKTLSETPHEEGFLRRYGQMIDGLLQGVKNPVDWTDPCAGTGSSSIIYLLITIFINWKLGYIYR